MKQTLSRHGAYPRIEFFCILLASIFGFLQAWASRFYMDPDGVNYLDLAGDWLRGDLRHAINSLWSPAYPFLVAVALRVTHSPADWESTILHAVNFLMYLAALMGFRLFFHELVPSEDRTLAWIIFAYALFTYGMLFLVTLGTPKPDLGVAAVLFASTGLVLRLQRAQTTAGYLLLGLLLGIGFWLKTIVLLFGLVMLGCAFMASLLQRKGAGRVVLSAIVLLAISAPLIAALSMNERRLTIGDSGSLNYEWYVASQGNAIHPVRVLMQHPIVEEFATPVGGTYPPWHDPAYWWQGVKPRLSARGQIAALWQGISDYARIFSQETMIALGVLILLFVFFDQRPRITESLGETSVAWLSSLALLGMYALVHVETRYVAAPIVILWCIVYRAVPATGQILTGTLLAVSLFLALLIAKGTATTLIHPPPRDQEVAAVEIGKLGLNAGDTVAVVGHSTVPDYWAHLLGVRIVADIPVEEVGGFWTIPGGNREALNALRSSGAKFAVTLSPPCCAQGWTRLGETQYYARALAGE